MADNTITNPQAMVDAALGTAPEPKPAETTQPPAQQMDSLPPQPTVDPSLLATPPSGPTPNVLPTQPATAPISTTPMGDDTPLAFAAMPSSQPAPTVADIPPAAGAAPLPPVGGSYNGVTNIVQPKPKSKMGKILALFIGFLALGGAVFGGYQYYVQNYGEQAKIAQITDPKLCTGCSKPPGAGGGGWLVWRDGQCKVTGTCNAPVDNQNSNNPNPTATPVTYNDKASCEADADGNPDTPQKRGAWCAGCNGFCNQTPDKGCNQLQLEKCGQAVDYGAAKCVTTGPDSTFKTPCDCDNNNTTDTWFDSTGLCFTGRDPDLGLCKLKEIQGGCTSAADQDSKFTCTDSGCTTKSGCVAVRYTCGSTSTNSSCVPSSPSFQSQSSVGQAGQKIDFTNKCGTVEQIDISCGANNYTASRTRINAPCSPSPKPSITTTSPSPSPKPSISPSPSPVAPVMACTGITKTPTTTPVIGTKLTFTCTGTITPASAGTLSYKFRYSVNNGTMKALTNKTATTTELTIDACGEYKVECQTCATIAGVLKCDPAWTGATQ